MTKDKVKDAVLDAIDNQFQDGCEAELTDTMIDLGMDSLDMVEIDLSVEKTLGCGDLGDVFDNFNYNTTVEQLIDAICKHLGI